MKQLLAAVMLLTASMLFSPDSSHAAASHAAARQAAANQAQVVQPQDLGRTNSIPCPIEVPDSVVVECGALRVPENYGDPESLELRLPYIILRSNNPDKAPDPLIYTAGGPGWSSLDAIWGFVHSPLLADRDVIVFEQRGNKYARPNLVTESPIWWAESSGAAPYLEAFKDKGVDIAQYNTQNIVRDLIALRRALGYERWNLYGTSFSTSLMLLVMQADPDGVRSAILQSVKPPNVTTFDHEADSALRAIQQIFVDCAAESRCAAAYPDLETRFYVLVEDLNRAPARVEVRTTRSSEPILIEVDGDTFIDWIVVHNLYQPAFPPFGTATLPLLIDEVSRGNLAPLATAAQSYWNSMLEDSHWSWGLLLAISCQQALPAAGENRPPADIAASERLDGFYRGTAQRAICQAWDLPALAPAAIEYVRSDVPALVLAGSYDPVTPPAWSRATADHLPNSTYVEFAGYGHNVTVDNPCAAELQTSFLNNPLEVLDISCVAEAEGPAFILPDDVYVAPGLAQSIHDVELGSPKGIGWLETLSITGLLGSFSLLAVLLVAGLVWLLRRRKVSTRPGKAASLAYLLALLVIVSGLVMPVLITQVNNEFLGTPLYALGPSRDFGPAGLLAWNALSGGLLILALAVLTLRAWLVQSWSTRFRIVATLVVLVSLLTLFLGLRWGLFTMLL